MVDYKLHNVWQNGLFVLAVLAILVGIWAFTMALTVILWVIIVIAIAVGLYFLVERIFGWGVGQ